MIHSTNNRNIYHARIYDIYDLPDMLGAYVITYISSDRLYALKYIGSTIDLKHRFGNHKDKVIHHIDIYMTDTLEFAQCLERILISILRPLCEVTNIMFYSISKQDQNIISELKESDTYEKLSKIGKEEIKIGYRYLAIKKPAQIIAGRINTISLSKETSNVALKAIEIINKKIGIRLNQKELIPLLLKDPNEVADIALKNIKQAI